MSNLSKMMFLINLCVYTTNHISLVFKIGNAASSYLKVLLLSNQRIIVSMMPTTSQ